MAVDTAVYGGNRVVIAQLGTDADALGTVSFTFNAITDLAKNGNEITQDLNLVITHTDLSSDYNTFITTTGVVNKVASAESIDVTTVDGVITSFNAKPAGATGYILVSTSGAIGTKRRYTAAYGYFTTTTESNDASAAAVTRTDTFVAIPTPREFTLTTASLDDLFSDQVTADATIVLATGSYGKTAYGTLL